LPGIDPGREEPESLRSSGTDTTDRERRTGPMPVTDLREPPGGGIPCIGAGRGEQAGCQDCARPAAPASGAQTRATCPVRPYVQVPQERLSTKDSRGCKEIPDQGKIFRVGQQWEWRGTGPAIPSNQACGPIAA